MEIKSLVEDSITMEFMSMLIYQDLANRVLDEGSKFILNYLSKQEEGHIAKLIVLFSNMGVDTKMAVEDVDIIKAHRKKGLEKLELALENKGLSPQSSIMEILDFAEEAEKHAFRHYTSMADNCEDGELESAFRTIAEEEKDHEVNIVRLKELLKK